MKYTKHITDQNFVRIATKDGAGIFGCIIDEDKDFVLMLHEDDFRHDGYKIIKKSIIQKVRHSKYEKFWKKLFAINKINIPKTKLQLDLPKLIKKFLTSKEMISIESCTSKKERFELGIVTKIGVNYIYLKPISADGKREKDKKYFFSNIHVLSRGSNYNRIYSTLIP